MRRILLPLVLATSLLMPLASTHAQNLENFSDDEAVKIARALAELEQRRVQVVAMQETLAAKDRHVAALEALIAEQARLIALWKTAAAERATANDADEKIQALYEESVKRYEAELARVREQRDDARRSRFTWAAIALVFGAVVGIVAARD